MGFVLIQHIADHTFVDQNRFRSGRRREDQLSAGVGFPFRHGGADTSGANVNHFFTLLGKMFFTPYGKEFFTSLSKQIFTS